MPSFLSFPSSPSFLSLNAEGIDWRLICWSTCTVVPEWQWRMDNIFLIYYFYSSWRLGEILLYSFGKKKKKRRRKKEEKGWFFAIGGSMGWWAFGLMVLNWFKMFDIIVLYNRLTHLISWCMWISFHLLWGICMSVGDKASSLQPNNLV